MTRMRRKIQSLRHVGRPNENALKKGIEHEQSGSAESILDPRMRKNNFPPSVLRKTLQILNQSEDNGFFIGCYLSNWRELPRRGTLAIATEKSWQGHRVEKGILNPERM